MEEQQEIWKDIIIEKNGIVYDYTGLYQVSNLGNVKSLCRVDRLGRAVGGKNLKLKTGKTGYMEVKLSKEGEAQMFYVHRIVATAFISNEDNLPQVNHKDENKANNNVKNLEWCTFEYNQYYGTRIDRMAKNLTGRSIPLECREKMSKRRKGEDNPNAKAVICINTKEVFTTIKYAKQWCGNNNIGNCCRGKQKYAGNHPETGERLQWMYYEDWLKLQENEKIAD